jgi:diguanylate cyclase (GGDEF)-like protein
MRRPSPTIRNALRHLARLSVLVPLAFAAAAQGAAAPAAAAPALPDALRTVLEHSLDDPYGSLAVAEASLDALDSESRFWRLLGKAAAYTLLDRPSDAQRSVDEARARLGRVPAATPRHHLWLEAYAIGALFRRQDSARLIARSVELRRAAAPLGDEHLLCEISAGDLFLLRDTHALDEAWRVAEETERCGRKLGQLHLETSALIAMGSMAGSLSGKAPAESYFERALEVLGGLPARYQRGWIEWELGNTLARLGKHERAARSFETSIARSRAIGDATGEAIVTLDLTELSLVQGEPERVLTLVRGVLPTLRAGEAPARLALAQGLVIEALARLKRPEVLQEIDSARALEQMVLPAMERAQLLRRIAEGLASQGLHARAYAELRRSNEAVALGQQSIRDTQVLRLQARYEITRREAELADLRHRAEADRLALQAREAQQQALWAAFAALVGLLAAAAWFGVRALKRRRQLADLVMRDELTGMPNRRAVLAFAQEQFDLCRRLGLELSVALVDIDHFKQVNDQHGHAAGDRVLRAFAQAAGEVLRGQERMGRYGGDEWLFVMPGVAIDELPALFERLRARLAAQPVAGLGHPHRVTLSMGAAALSGAVDSLEALVDEADRQLYRAKAEGRDALRCARAARIEGSAAAADGRPQQEPATLPLSA